MNNYYMEKALLKAKKAFFSDEIPVGCVIVLKNKIIACGYNKKECKKNCLLHAEIVAIEKACRKLKTWRLDDCEMYVTLEPCMMCMGAIIESRIKKVYYGAKSNSEHLYLKDKIHKYVDLYCMNDSECSKILSEFFINKRKKGCL